MKILITGASGSGTTTLARHLEAVHGLTAIDTDDYYWLPTDPPYETKRDEGERLQKALADISACENVVVSGSIMGWGEQLENLFDLVAFLYLDTTTRIERLRARELQELGSVDEAFIEWAADYDSGPAMGRSLARHEQWLSARQCAVVRIEGDLTVIERARRLLAAIPGGLKVKE